jgi:hypothetical protein
MVIEYFDDRSFFDWLLGEGWAYGAFFRAFPSIALLIVLAILVGVLIARMLERPLTRSRGLDGFLIALIITCVGVVPLTSRVAYPPEIQVVTFKPAGVSADGYFAMGFEEKVSKDIQFVANDPALTAAAMQKALIDLDFLGTRVARQSELDFKVTFAGYSSGNTYGDIRILPPESPDVAPFEGGGGTSATLEKGVGRIPEQEWGYMQWLFGPDWYRSAFLLWALVAGGVAFLAFLVACLFSILRRGPAGGIVHVCGCISGVADDLLHTSPRRVLALSWLAVREAIRRRVVVVFAIFIILLLFAGWFLDPTSPNPAQLYLSFVLLATTYLMLILAGILSTLSLPEDIKRKTIFTIVTKPVRPTEIVLGRIIGFAAVGTVLLAVMGTISYVFVSRGLTHSHALEAEKFKSLKRDGKETGSFTAKTELVGEHRHTATRDEKGTVRLAVEQGHWHDVTASGDGEDATYSLGAPQGMLIARVPVFGRLRFTDRRNNLVQKGVNVGDEWGYRSFIEGSTLASAIWTFRGISEDMFPEDEFPQGIPVEMNIEVFRTHKGETDNPEDIPGIPGSLSILNPRNDELIEARIFTAKDFVTIVQYLPRTVEDKDGNKLDLFKDLTKDGQLTIVLRCLHPSQYFGAAQADIYLRARDKSFAMNFTKAYVAIWLQMLIIISIGVMFSTFLSGPVATIGTMWAFTTGLFSHYMGNLGASVFMGKESMDRAGMEYQYGGGPVEAIIRLLTQQNVTSQMEKSLRTDVAQMIDGVLGYIMFSASYIFPRFNLHADNQFNASNSVANGFDISGDTMSICICRTIAYMIPVCIAAFLFLKTREVAK